MSDLSEAIERGRHAWQTKHGKCTMCAAGDEPVLGYHRQFRPCGNETRFFYRHCLARIFRVDVKDIDRWMDTGKLGSMVDGIGRRCCAIWHVRYFILLYGRDGEKADRLRKHIFEAYEKHPHAFEQGSGRDTMAYWICEATGVRHSKRAIRRALDEMAKEGLFVKGVNHSGHTTYHMVGAPERRPEPAPGPTQPGWRLESQGRDELILRRLGPTSKADWYEDPRL